MKLQPGRLLFVPQTRLGLPGKVHTNTTAGSHGPRRPVPPRTPSPQLQPRCAAKSSCSRSPPVASPPNSRCARTWPSVLPAAAGRAAGERNHGAGSLAPPRRAARSTAGLGEPPSFLASRLPARPRACRCAASAEENSAHLLAEFFRSLPSSPEPHTPASRVEKGCVEISPGKVALFTCEW